MPISPEQQRAFEQRLLQEWARQVEDVLIAQLRARGARVPSDTLKNLRMEVLSAASQLDGTQAYLSFQDSGRHVDMKVLKYAKRGITRDKNFIQEWVEKLGPDKFAYVPGVNDESRQFLSRESQVKRIANAIIASRGGRVAVSRARSKDRAWFSRPFYAQVNRLIEELLEKQADLVLKETAKDVQNAFKTT